MLSLRLSFFQISFAVILTLSFAHASIAGGPSTIKNDEWYITKWTHATMEHIDHAAHAMAGTRIWEPYREIDPHSVTGFQEMYEVTQFPHGEQATVAQRREADALVRRSREAAHRHGWFDFGKA